MKNIEIFGDSILRGVTFDETAKRYRLCRGSKLESLSALGFEVKNHSRMGHTVKDGVDSASAHAAFSEDTLVLTDYCGNDCDHDWDSVARAPEAAHLPRVAGDVFVREYSALIDGIRKKGGRAAVVLPPPIDADKYFAFIARNRDGDAILRWLGDRSMLSRWHEYYCTLVREVANHTGCPLVDLHTPFLLRHDFKSLICADGVHPTQKGHDLIERLLCEFAMEHKAENAVKYSYGT